MPGARLIPLDELPERLGELDRALPTIVYCAAGVRSRAAASVLQNAGFARPHSLAGGIRAWQGVTAEGVPEPEMAFFASVPAPEQQVALAWFLEDRITSYNVCYTKLLRFRAFPLDCLVERVGIRIMGVRAFPIGVDRVEYRVVV